MNDHVCETIDIIRESLHAGNGSQQLNVFRFALTTEWHPSPACHRQLHDREAFECRAKTWFIKSVSSSKAIMKRYDILKVVEGTHKVRLNQGLVCQVFSPCSCQLLGCCPFLAVEPIFRKLGLYELFETLDKPLLESSCHCPTFLNCYLHQLLHRCQMEARSIIDLLRLRPTPAWHADQIFQIVSFDSLNR